VIFHLYFLFDEEYQNRHFGAFDVKTLFCVCSVICTWLKSLTDSWRHCRRSR